MALSTPADTAPIASVAANPDAELVALSTRFVALGRRIDAIGRPHYTLEEEPAIEAAIAPLSDEQYALAKRMLTISASGIAGLRAKARALTTWEPELAYESNAILGAGLIPSLVASIINDLTNGG